MKATLFCPLASASPASLLSLMQVPVTNNRSMSAFKSFPCSKQSRARSKRHTASSLVHFVSASAAGSVRTISRAESKSSSCYERSVVTWSASSFRSEKPVRSDNLYTIMTDPVLPGSGQPCSVAPSGSKAKFPRLRRGPLVTRRSDTQ